MRSSQLIYAIIVTTFLGISGCVSEFDGISAFDGQPTEAKKQQAEADRNAQLLLLREAIKKVPKGRLDQQTRAELLNLAEKWATFASAAQDTLKKHHQLNKYYIPAESSYFKFIKKYEQQHPDLVNVLTLTYTHHINILVTRQDFDLAPSLSIDMYRAAFENAQARETARQAADLFEAKLSEF